MASEHSKACCEAPVPDNMNPYQENGEWLQIAGRKTYINGSKTATRAIVWVYDIFGYSPQTLRGADIVARDLSAGNSPALIIVPDWFDGCVAEKAWVPPVTPEQQEKLGGFIQNKASPGLVVPRVLEFTKDIKNVFTSVEKIGIFGFCWGGKLASLACQQDKDSFVVAVQTSPARIDPEEAKNVSVPMALLSSGDEDADLIAKFADNLHSDKLLEVFSTQIHGWMSGRGDLEDPNVKAEYERGYKIAVGFFDKHL
ncbi:putative dienelactone hydrolase [Talaromyces proteolyticus]|uniref:Dienelactone hydrolase n=1 Tax=Talaromyces proteolyticus TaxID=1131652 RepID=A0AAD4L0B9_9EURO|nr:putative dienelactone hydrolase [Talaromyces proteolyticus]KAH8705228.1 putative dienelactone hydrolase [Talaromyces proteolyticus]